MIPKYTVCRLSKYFFWGRYTLCNGEVRLWFKVLALPNRDFIAPSGTHQLEDHGPLQEPRSEEYVGT